MTPRHLILYISGIIILIAIISFLRGRDKQAMIELLISFAWGSISMIPQNQLDIPITDIFNRGMESSTVESFVPPFDDTPKPTDMLTLTDMPKPTPTSLLTPTPTLLPIQVGEVISFGRYKQNNDKSNGAEPVEWQVLDVDYSEGRALLLSKYVLDMQRYNSSWSKVSWKKCSVHSWLNDKFLKTCFSRDETKAIIRTSLSSWYVDESVSTYDYVFFLSVDEAVHYLPSAAERQAKPTDYAAAREVVVKGGYCYWWLRDSTNRKNDANRVNPQGAFEEYGANTNAYGVGVRPAVWVDYTMLGV